MQPVIKVRDGNLSVAGFQKESKEGKPYISFVIQRSYTIDNEQKHENINIFANDLLRISALCDEAYKQTLNLAKPKKEEPQVDEQPVQDPLDDDIPF